MAEIQHSGVQIAEDDEHAKAIAAAGVRTGLTAAQWRRAGAEPLHHALRVKGPVTWSLGFPRLRPGTPETRALAAQWDRATELGRPLRLEVRTPANEPVEPWLAALLSPAVGLAGAYAVLRRARPKAARRWHRPPTIGLMAAGAVEVVAVGPDHHAALPDDAWDVLLVGPQAEHALPTLQAARISAGWVIGLSEADDLGAINDVGSLVDAHGRAALALPPDRHRQFAERLAKSLQEATIDVALVAVARSLGDPAPLIGAVSRAAVRQTDPSIVPPDTADHALRARSRPRSRAGSGILMHSAGDPIAVDPTELQRWLYSDQGEATDARFVQARLAAPGPGAGAAMPRPGETIDLRVHVGPRHSTRWQSSSEPLPEEWPDRDARHLLDVVTVLPTVLKEPDRQSLMLPGRGASQEVSVRLDLPPEPIAHHGRLIVLHRGRVLQTLLMTVDATGRSADAGGLRIEPEALLKVRLNALDTDSRPFDAAFVANHDPAGSPGVTVIPADGLPVSQPQDWSAVAKLVLGLLQNLVDDGPGADAAGTLAGLANAGALLRRVFEDRVGPLPAGVPALQVLSARPDAWMPVELFYDGPVPDETSAQLCARGMELLADDDLGVRCDATHGDDVVCPLGFWGLRMLIERQVHDPTYRDAPWEWLLRAEPTRDQGELSVPDAAVFAAHRNVDMELENATALVEAAMASAGMTSPRVWSWPDWCARVESERPGMLIALSHTATPWFVAAQTGHEAAAPPTLEIEKGTLQLMGVKRRHVAATTAEQPLVLLLGCRTAAPECPSMSFAAAFQRQGAPVVVATITDVLGRHAGPVTSEAVTYLTAPGQAGMPVGEAMLRLRRRLFANDQLLGLALTAFGDADWRLNSRTEDQTAR
jgi:hypothetical protein